MGVPNNLISKETKLYIRLNRTHLGTQNVMIPSGKLRFTDYVLLHIIYDGKHTIKNPCEFLNVNKKSEYKQTWVNLMVNVNELLTFNSLFFYSYENTV